MPQTSPPDHESVLQEVRAVRGAGIVRLRDIRVERLTRIAAGLGPAAGDGTRGSVERLLRQAVSRMDPGNLREAAEYSLGLVRGTLDWPPSERRRRAAQVYGVSVERFRKHQERLVLGEVAEQVLRIAAAPAPSAGPAGPAGPGPGDRADPPELPPTHRTLRVPGTGAEVTVHVHPVDLLRDVDVVVCPANTYFTLPGAYKSSVPASLRRAGALRDATGGLLRDRVDEELRGWLERHGSPGRPVLPGTVAATGPGELARQGIRRIYHAAVAVPRPGTNDYHVEPADVTRAAARVFAVLSAEHRAFAPPLRSVCFPLVGAGRGGLRAERSIGALWAAVEAELARGTGWDVHFVVRRPDRADLLRRLLTGGCSDGAVRP